MPHTLAQRIMATLMLGASVVLVVLISLQTRSDTTPQPTSSVTATTGVTREAATRSRPKEAAQPVAVNGETKAKLKATTTFLFKAAEDTWLEVRGGSQDGDLLYTGILQQGRSVAIYTGISQQGRRTTSTGKRLWVRFAGASDVAATVNGKPLPLPAGTYNALISPAGLEQVPG